MNISELCPRRMMLSYPAIGFNTFLIMKTTVISTSKIKTYKFILIAITVGILLFWSVFIIRVLMTGENYFMIANFAVYGFLVYKVITHINKIKSISFDDSSIYYIKDDYEVQVPFEDIKDIEIKSLDGLYEIKFYSPTQDGERIFFKSSLWYPLNFKKQDDLVNVLRDKIDRYKRTLPEQHYQQLSSYNI